jgi:hypothetical protein
VSSHRDTAVAIAIRRKLSTPKMAASSFAKDSGGTDIFHPIDLLWKLMPQQNLTDFVGISTS